MRAMLLATGAAAMLFVAGCAGVKSKSDAGPPASKAALEAKPILATGRTKPIAISSLKRSPAFPDIPTAAEAGLAGFESLSWYGLWAPAGTDAAIVSAM